MEDSSQKWEIREYCSPGFEDEEPEKTRLEWILGAGLNLGKKFVITGVVFSSAPIVLPPLIVVSALGVAFSVPFGFVYASYACTQKLMSKLFPSPSPPEMNYLEFLPYGEKWEEDDKQDMYNGFDRTVDSIEDYNNSGLEYHRDHEEKLASSDTLPDTVGYDYGEIPVNDNLGQTDETLCNRAKDESKKEELEEHVSKDSKLSDEEQQSRDIVVPVAVEDTKSAGGYEEPSAIIATPVAVEVSAGDYEESPSIVDVPVAVSVGDYEEPPAIVAVPVAVEVVTVIDDQVGEKNEEDKKLEEQKMQHIAESALGIPPVEPKSVDAGEGERKRDVDSKEKQTDLEDKNAKVEKVRVGVDGSKRHAYGKGKGSDPKGKKKDKRHDKVKTSGETNLSMGQVMNGKSTISNELSREAIPEVKIKEVKNKDEHKSSTEKGDVEAKKLVDTQKKGGESLVQTVEVVPLVGSPVEVVPLVSSPESKGNDSVSEDSILHREKLIADEKIWNQIDAIRTIVGFKVPRQTSYFEELKALYVFTGIEPAFVFVDPSNLVEFNDKLRLLMSVIGVK